MISSIKTISLPVSDQDRAKKFYCDKLGFKVVREHPFMNDAQWIELQPKDGGTSIVLTTWFDTMPAGSIQGLILGVDDVMETHKALAERGVEISEVETAPWGQFIRLTDSEGNKLVIQQANNQ